MAKTKFVSKAAPSVPFGKDHSKGFLKRRKKLGWIENV